MKTFCDRIVVPNRQNLTTHHPNSPFVFKSKAETLAGLMGKLRSAKILPLHYFTLADWREDPAQVLQTLQAFPWSKQALIVRSSAHNEDTHESSQAGRYASVLNVTWQGVSDAITSVIDSYPEGGQDEDQVLIQPMLSAVHYCGVAFGCDPNTGSSYRVINYDDTGATDGVTSGRANALCHYHYGPVSQLAPSHLQSVIALIGELADLIGTEQLDIEFALTESQELYLLQVRPLVNVRVHRIAVDEQTKALQRISDRVTRGMQPHPYLFGRKTLYTVMTDWNPAEIIGIRPKRLAFSLYKELVTDSVWAYQRDNYGYRNLRSFPLMMDFEGFPYIDVRVCVNSFIPKQLPDALAEKLVNYSIQRLEAEPHLQDKVEFEIVFSCYTLDVRPRLRRLLDHGFSESELEAIAAALTALTNRVIHKESGLWVQDLEKIKTLSERYDYLMKQALDPITKIYWLIEDCKRYGTLPFAGLARAGFIAVQLLKSLVTEDYLTESQYHQFMTSLESVSSMMQNDLLRLEPKAFLEIYGHLRPGTYDIGSLRYDEAPEGYFNFTNGKESAIEVEKKAPFAMPLKAMRAIQDRLLQDGIDTDVLALFEFIKIAIEGREYAKFVFTRNVSQILKLIESVGASYHLSREDCAHLDIQEVIDLYSTSSDPAAVFNNSIQYNRKRYELTQTLVLPPVLMAPKEVWSFVLNRSKPNFITQLSTIGPVYLLNGEKQHLEGAIVFIPNADPGYDWIFSHNIKGFVTQYGGVNSHMAIRAVELNLPAVVGAGELLYSEWSKAKRLSLDCNIQQVLVVA